MGLFFVCFGLLLTIGSSVSPPFQELWFKQAVDHFSTTNNVSFQQRFLIPSKIPAQSTDSIRPIFFYTGNEGSIESFWANTGFIFDIAGEFDAFIVFAEHRYYGKSFPFGEKDSYSRQNIGFLTVEQALADFATLIPYVKKTFNLTDSPVIAFGGSYGGMLRLKYPTVVAGALSASAPIPMATGGIASPKYFQTVTDDFIKANPKCPTAVREAFTQMSSLMTTSEGRQHLTSLFGLCDELQAKDQEQLFEFIKNAFGDMAMCDYPYESSFLAPLPAWPMKVSCDYFLNNPPLIAMQRFINLFYNGGEECLDLYSLFISCSDQTGCGTGTSGTSWSYQACTQIIYFPNATNITDMFPPKRWNMQSLTSYCQNRWGVTPNPTRFMEEFGSDSFKHASNIIFSNGGLDPWSGGGFLKPPSPQTHTVFIELGAHHLDLRESHPEDPLCVRKARQYEIDLIQQYTETA